MGRAIVYGLACVMLFSAAHAHAAPLVGQQAPGFALGGPASLADYKGRVIALCFWTKSCVSCRAELKAMDALYGRDGFVAIGIAVGMTEAEVAEYKSANAITLPLVADPHWAIADEYGITGLPTSFLLDKGLVIRHWHQGYGSQLLPVIEKELEGLSK